MRKTLQHGGEKIHTKKESSLWNHLGNLTMSVTVETQLRPPFVTYLRALIFPRITNSMWRKNCRFLVRTARDACVHVTETWISLLREERLCFVNALSCFMNAARHVAHRHLQAQKTQTQTSYTAMQCLNCKACYLRVSGVVLTCGIKYTPQCWFLFIQKVELNEL